MQSAAGKWFLSGSRTKCLIGCLAVAALPIFVAFAVASQSTNNLNSATNQLVGEEKAGEYVPPNIQPHNSDLLSTLVQINFDDWRSLTGPPIEWGLPGFDTKADKFGFVISNKVEGRGILQTWHTSDANSNIFHQFGTPIRNINRSSVYKVDLFARYTGHGDILASVWSVDDRDQAERVTHLTRVGDGHTTLYFETREHDAVRLVVGSYNVVEPTSITWYSWHVTELTQNQLLPTLTSAFNTNSSPDSDDPSDFKKLDESENLDVLDQAINAAFQSSSIPNDQNTAITLLGYAAQILKPGSYSSALGSEQLTKGIGYCEGRSTVMVAMSRRLGMPARRVNFRNVGSVAGTHVAVELYYDDAWHYFDPSYALCFIGKSNRNSAGKVFSAKELFADPYNRSHPLVLDVVRLSGNYLPRAGFLQHMDAEASTMYARIFLSSFPNAPHDRGVAAVFPLDFDLRASRQIKFGEVNNDSYDVYDQVENGRYDRNRGDAFIGRASNRSSSHLITIIVPGPGRGKIHYYFPGQTLWNCLGTIEVKGIMISGSDVEPIPEKDGTWKWTIDFIALEDTPTFLVDLRQVSPRSEFALSMPVDAVAAEFTPNEPLQP